MTLQSMYEAHCRAGTAMSPHLPRLRELASDSISAVEFGVKRGASSTALLLGLGEMGRLTSYDILATADALALKSIVGHRWTYLVEDSARAIVPPANLMFFDSLHTYDQVAAELRHVSPIARYLVFHDVTTFGEVGAEGETGRQSWTYVAGKGSVPSGHFGIRPAIDDFMICNPSWHIIERRVESHGLLVLGR